MQVSRRHSIELKFRICTHCILSKSFYPTFGEVMCTFFGTAACIGGKGCTVTVKIGGKLIEGGHRDFAPMCGVMLVRVI